MKKSFNITSRVLLTYSIAAGVLAAYRLQLAETEEYMGYKLFDIDLPFIAATIAGLSITAILLPKKIEKPSHFFPLFYGLYVLLPYATLHPIRHSLEFWEFALFFFTLALPLISAKLILSLTPAVRFPSIISQSIILFIIVLLCVIGITFAMANPPASAGFNLLDVYTRREEGRTNFSDRTLQAYINSAIANGFAPFLAFYAGLQRNVRLLALSLLCWLAYFYLLGLKAPILYIFIAFIVGKSIRARQLDNISWFISLLPIFLIIIFFIEYILFEFSFVAEYFLRRAFSVPPYLASAYFEFMRSDALHSWKPLTGSNSSEPITYVIGENFLWFAGLNANTNAFLYQLAAGGVSMYIITIFLVSIVFTFLDSAYTKKKLPALLYLGFSFAILITEQAATTALVSSGVGVLTVLTVLSRDSQTESCKNLTSSVPKNTPN